MESILALPSASVSFNVGDIAEVSGFVGRIVRIFGDSQQDFASLMPIGKRGGGVTVPVSKLSPVR
jgi:hypothetical protein